MFGQGWAFVWAVCGQQSANFPFSTNLLAAASVKEGENSQNKSNDQLHSRLSRGFFCYYLFNACAN